MDCTGTVLYTNLLKSLTFLLGALGKIPCPWIGFASGEQIIAGDEWLSNVKLRKQLTIFSADESFKVPSLCRPIYSTSQSSRLVWGAFWYIRDLSDRLNKVAPQRQMYANVITQHRNCLKCVQQNTTGIMATQPSLTASIQRKTMKNIYKTLQLPKI